MRNIKEAAAVLLTADDEYLTTVARRDPSMFRDVAAAYIAEMTRADAAERRADGAITEAGHDETYHKLAQLRGWMTSVRDIVIAGLTATEDKSQAALRQPAQPNMGEDGATKPETTKIHLKVRYDEGIQDYGIVEVPVA